MAVKPEILGLLMSKGKSVAQLTTEGWVSSLPELASLPVEFPLDKYSPSDGVYGLLLLINAAKKHNLKYQYCATMHPDVVKVK